MTHRTEQPAIASTSKTEVPLTAVREESRASKCVSATSEVDSRWDILAESWSNEIDLEPDVANGKDLAKLLAAILSGQMTGLHPGFLPDYDNLTLLDSLLDAEQTEAVHRLVRTPDVGLLAGQPGTGKSRVLSEILRQAVRRGERVLLTACRAAAFDSLIENSAAWPEFRLIRLVPPRTEIKALPLATQTVTPTELVKRLAGPLQARLRQQIEHWKKSALDRSSDLEDLQQLQPIVDRWIEAENERTALEQQRQQSPECVQAEAAQAVSGQETGWIRNVQEEKARHAAALQGLEDRRQAALVNFQAKRQEHDKWVAQAQNQGAIVEVRSQRRWLSWQWWRSLFQGRTEERLKEFEQREAEARQALVAAEAQARDLDTQLDLEKQRHATALEQIYSGEVERRQTELNRRLATAECVHDNLRASWRLQRSKLRLSERLTEFPDADSFEQIKRELHEAQRQATQRATSAQEWLAQLEKSQTALTTTLMRKANVVVGDMSCFTCEPSSENIPVGAFSLSIVDHADELTAEELLAIAHRTTRLMLVGRPRWPAADPLPGSMAAGSGGAQSLQAPFHRLWRSLHCDPTRLPFRWVQKQESLVYQRVPLTPEERQRLEKEPVTDLPDIELCILNRSDAEPLLAEVVFPCRSFQIAAAKTFLYQQLDELALRPEAARLSWGQQEQRLSVYLHPNQESAADDIEIELGEGVFEVVRPSESPTAANGQRPIQWSTARLVFDLRRGWDRARADQWLWERAGLRDWGRTAVLNAVWRAQPGLNAVWTALRNEAQSDGARCALPNSEGGEDLRGDAVEFIATSTVDQKPRGGSGKAPATGKAQAGGKPVAGLEADLSEPRHRQQLPLELQMKLPLRGIVNFAEAEAVIRALESLTVTSPTRSFAVLSWQPPQLQLLEFLWRRTSEASRTAVSFATARQFRGCEADTVLVSLCRSTSEIAVQYAEHPEHWRTLLTCARRRLLVFGDPATLTKHMSRTTGWERELVKRLLGMRVDQSKHLCNPDLRANALA